MTTLSRSQLQMSDAEASSNERDVWVSSPFVSLGDIIPYQSTTSRYAFSMRLA